MTPTTIDAIRSPSSHAGAGGSLLRLSNLQSEFAALLGVERVYVRNQGTEHFVTGDPADTLDHPQGEPNAGRPRYDWRDRGDGVLYGTLRDRDQT